MKKLIFLIILAFGLNSIPCYADYSFENVDNMYHTILPGQVICFVEHKAASDDIYPLYFYSYFDIGKSDAALFQIFIDDHLDHTQGLHNSFWFKCWPPLEMTWLTPSNRFRGHTKAEMCYVNKSKESGLYIKASFDEDPYPIPPRID